MIRIICSSGLFILSSVLFAQESADFKGKWIFTQHLPSHREIQHIKMTSTDSVSLVMSSNSRSFDVELKDGYLEWTGSIQIKDELFKVNYVGMLKKENKMKGLLFIESPAYHGRGASWSAKKISSE